MRLPLSGDWDGLVVILAANSWDAVKMADRHLAEHLTRHAPVLYVDPPVSWLTPWRQPEVRESLLGPRVRAVAPRLVRLTPVVSPGPLRPGIATLTSALVRRALAAAVRGLGAQVRAVVSAAPLLDVFGACGEVLRIYWAQDDFVAAAQLIGHDAGRLAEAELRSGGGADLVVAANPSVAARWRRLGHESVLIPYGTDWRAYRSVEELPPPADVRLPRPIAGFVGHINDRIQLALLEAVATHRQSLLLVGPMHPHLDHGRMAALLARPNVQWVGPKAFDQLPPYLGTIDVGLVPYTRSAFNLGSFPLKTLEYLAAGRPVVTSDLPATRWLDTEFIAIANHPESFARIVDALLAEPRDAALINARREFARRHGWDERANAWADLLGLGPAAGRELTA
jgi:teichuronic acid biosynthesis glycosyltransferase TuaH